MESTDVEISEETFIIKRETAMAYREAQAKPPVSNVHTSPVDQLPSEPYVGVTTGTLIPPAESIPKPTLTPSGGRSISWSGDIPAQKWMNFYTRVLSKFATGGGLRVTVHVEIAPDGGVSQSKLEETRSALRELGLNDKLDAEI